jgi:PAS domain S-box-containing protein
VQRAFFESSEPVMLLRDVEGRYLLVNRAAEQVLGLPRTHLIGRLPRECFSGEEAGSIELHDQRVLERGEALTFQEEYGTGRERRRMLVTRFPVRDDAGTVRYLGTVARDETNERELHERLNRAQRVELVGQLAAGLAHDLNNLLSIVITNLAVLRARRTWHGEEAEMLQDMREAGERSIGLTQRLLSFGRREATARSALKVDDALRALEPLLRALARGSVDVEGRYGAPGVRVVADASELEQIVLNLVSNARDAIPGEGRITLSTELAPHPLGAQGAASGRWLQLRVSDTGVGMDAGTLSRLFQPFFTTKGTKGGTGLGLYTTALLVRELGGEVHATSTPGEGTTFVVGLPVAPEP